MCFLRPQLKPLFNPRGMLIHPADANSTGRNGRRESIGRGILERIYLQALPGGIMPQCFGRYIVQPFKLGRPRSRGSSSESRSEVSGNSLPSCVLKARRRMKESGFCSKGRLGKLGQVGANSFFKWSGWCLECFPPANTVP